MRGRVVVTTLLFATFFPGAARASAEADATATRSAIRATLAADRELRAAAPRAGGAAQTTRSAARRCLADFERVPVVEQETVYGYYFVSLASGLWFVDKPILRRWIVDGLAPAARRSTAWRGDGFAPDRRPTVIEALRRAAGDPALQTSTWPAAAIEHLLLRSADPRAERVMFLLNRGTDEPDDRVERSTDPIVDLFRV